jgi:hypothetical protein
LQASCEGGEKYDNTAGSYSMATNCGDIYFRACRDRVARMVEPCKSFKGNAKCALKDFEGIHRGKHGQLV